MPLCSDCGQANPAIARFCVACGARLPADTRTGREVRKRATSVFTDVTESTSLAERLDVEGLRRVMGRYFDEMRAVVERHGGTVEKFMGDVVMRLPLLEPVAAGVHVVATPVGGVAGVARHEVEVLLVPPPNAGAFAQAIDGILGDRVLAKRLAGAARERAEEFSPDAEAPKIGALSDELVSQSP